MNNELFSTLLEDEEYITYEDVCNCFNKHFPNKSINDLNLIEIRNDNHSDIRVTFKLDENVVCFILEGYYYDDNCGNGCFWRTIDRKIVDINHSCEDITIIDGSTDLISYEIYPFEQTHEFTLTELGFPIKKCESPSYFEENDEIKWTNGYVVKVGENDKGITYSVYLNDKFISGICDQSYSLQLGDGYSEYHMLDNTLCIENCGDVSSIVIIKC